MAADRELSVVAPCFNESENLPELHRRVAAVFAAAGIRGELVLVNDGSSDATGELIDSLAAANDHVRGVHHEQNRGIATAWQTGLDACRGEYVCLIDADLQYQPEDVARLFDEIRRSDVAMVQGARSVPSDERDARYLYSRVLNSTLNLLFGMRLRDNKSGFVLCRKPVLAGILGRRDHYNYFQCFIAIAAHHAGQSIGEIDVRFPKRPAGHSFMSALPLKVIFGVLADLPRGVLEFRIRRPRARD